MNRQEANELAKLVEDSTYQGVRDGLLHDLRAGKYRENGPMAMPFESLFIALTAVEAPREVIDRAREIQRAAARRASPNGPPDASSAEIQAALAQLYGTAGSSAPFALPTETDIDGLAEDHLKQLLPPSAFLDAVIKDREETLAREIADAEPVQLGDSFTVSPQ